MCDVKEKKYRRPFPERHLNLILSALQKRYSIHVSNIRLFENIVKWANNDCRLKTKSKILIKLVVKKHTLFLYKAVVMEFWSCERCPMTVKEKKQQTPIGEGGGIVYSSGCIARRRFWAYDTFVAGTRERNK